MAYIDFKMQPPAAESGRRQTATDVSIPTRSKAARVARPRAAMWVGGSIALLIAALIFALAFVSIGEPFVAATVTVLLLLPAASLFGGDARRRA